MLKSHKKVGWARIFNYGSAPVYFNWMPLAVLFVLIVFAHRAPGLLTGYASLLALIVLHEIGHAAVARGLGWPAQEIYIHVLFGKAMIPRSPAARDRAKIAWGGILVQALVAAPTVALVWAFGYTDYLWLNVPLAVLGHINLITIPLNLIPARPFDGGDAWSIFPILYREEIRARLRKRAERRRRGKLRPL